LEDAGIGKAEGGYRGRLPDEWKVEDKVEQVQERVHRSAHRS
jgi:hypothetical protein